MATNDIAQRRHPRHSYARMSFTDPAFLFVALPFALLVFYSLARWFGKNAAFGAMFALSIAAYSSWGLHNVALLLMSVTVNFSVAQVLISLPDERGGARRAALWFGQAYNFCTLIWFKYQFVQLLLQRATGDALTPLQIALPIGISFYTFQQAAFLMDAHHRDRAVVDYIGGLRGWFARAGGFIRYGAFATFFPQLMIGPISYLREFQRQAASERFGRMRQQDIAAGLALLGIGFFKKSVIADSLGPIAGPIFTGAAQGVELHAATAWIGVFAFYAQLYFDFSGYSDMALGIARLFGVRLPINFYSPLKAVGIVDYYRRWHMTLTRVISRFLFTPLSLAGTRWAMARRLPKGLQRMLALWIPLLVNFEVIALWHGAAATFVVFGLMHGTWYVLETEVRASRRWKAWRDRTSAAVRTCMGRALFVLPMALTFALFRSESLNAATHLFGQLFPLGGFAHAQAARDVGAALGIGGGRPHAPMLLKLAAAYALIYLAPNSIEMLRRWRPGIPTYDNRSYGGIWNPRWRPDGRWTAAWLALVVASLYCVSQQAPFIYMGF